MDNTAYGPTPSVGAADFQAVTLKEYHTENWTNTTGADVPAGGVVVVNGMALVAVGGVPNGQTGTLTYLEAFNVVKDNSVFAQNDPVYWQAAGNPVGRSAGSGAASSSSASSAPLMGFALKAAVTGDDRVQVSLRPMNGTAVNLVSVLTNAIADPGAAGAIPVTVGGTCELSGTTGTQTRTLAAPTFAGQELMLVTSAITSGTLTVTVTNLLNSAGAAKTTIAQSTAGMATALRAIAVGASLYWSVVSSGGTVA
jgi:hypothetical protein